MNDIIHINMIHDIHLILQKRTPYSWVDSPGIERPNGRPSRISEATGVAAYYAPKEALKSKDGPQHFVCSVRRAAFG
jgi:hypothetical protein